MAQEAPTKQYVDDPGPETYGAEQLPAAAHIEDFRPGAIIEDAHRGKTFSPRITVTSYPHTLRRNDGLESVWVDVTKEYPPSGGKKGFTCTDFMSLQDSGVVPMQRGGVGVAGMYNRYNVARLVQPAPVTDPTVPRSLRKLLEQPYNHLTAKEKAKATRYFLGQQAASFLERKRRGVKEPLLKHTSVEV